MFTPTNHGFSADLMKTVRDILEEGVPKTSAGATEAKVVQAVGQIKHFAKEMYKGDIKKAYNDWAGKTTFGPVLKAEVLKRAGGVNEATDPVDKKELTKSFEKRKDKDIDNDGDTDSSDEYLHKRRKAISKTMKEESDVDEGFINLGGAKVKDDEKSILQHIKKTFPNVKKVKKDSQHGWIPVFEANKDLEEGKKGYKKESDDSSNDEKMTDAQKNDMNGDGDKDKKNEKKKNREKVDSIDTDPEMSDTMVQERAGEKLASYEREKLDDLKKKHEGGKMHRALRRQYGDKGDEIFYGKLTKMAKGEYDGSQSKSEELQLTSEDLNTLDELQRLGQQFDEARGRPPKGDDADDAGSKNFVMQMRKSVSLRGQNTVTFDDGSKMKVDQRKAQTFLNRFMDLKKPAEKEMLMKSASKSPKHFDMALQGKVAKDSKPSMLPPLKSEK
jgi:hypothetical protein